MMPGSDPVLLAPPGSEAVLAYARTVCPRYARPDGRLVPCRAHNVFFRKTAARREGEG
jgi:hypothetical protein